MRSYVALCYSKLDYYDVSQEILQVYLDKYRDSSVVGGLAGALAPAVLSHGRPWFAGAKELRRWRQG